MTYRTKAAEELVDKLIRKQVLFHERPGDDPYSKGLNTGYAAAYEHAVQLVREALPQIEADAFLLPAENEQAVEWLRSEMAGDWRDMPAEDAA